MKIGYLTGQYPRATDTFIQREVFALRKFGFDVQTFSVRQPSPEQLVGPEQQSEFEQTSYLLPPRFLKLFIAHIVLLFTQFFQYIKTLRLTFATSQPGLKGLIFQFIYFLEAGGLARELKRRNIDHLHNHIADSSCTVAMLAAELSGVSFSFTIHGPYIFFEPYRWCLGEKIKQALFVACISNFCRSQCMLFSPTDCWSKLHIVHCGVEPELFSTRTHEGIGTRLLYVGRLAAAKGLPVLFESLSALKQRVNFDVVLTVIGDGPDRVQLESQVSQLNLEQSVRFIGYQNQTEVRRYLQETDIFVLPSFAEGVPVSLMEALASGIPVISTQIAGIAELVENGKNGYLVTPGDSSQLAEKIEKLCKQPDLRQSFGETGQRVVAQEFNVLIEAQWLSKLIEASSQGLSVPIRPLL